MYLLVSTDVTIATVYFLLAIPSHQPPTRSLELVWFKPSAKHTSIPHYIVNQSPRVVLDKLERMGFNLVGTSGVGQSLVWTTHKIDS
ncbi:hypothetical protein THRCLA_20650 [Thraustotheca clavata]|uniref:GTP cyclohydrolase 1 feedback regulatory protein n=1 Tax=Thraustotheca clavata TaxID=74557 RepID=A0A1W0A4X7_9STRA|nr:hypothetical protein THRCLA_20650 [Thraustotheca clavata]